MLDVRYDRQADALYVRFRANTKIVRTVCVTPVAAADLDRRGRVVGFELLDASAQLDAGVLESLPVAKEWLTLREAERASGLRASTLRVLLNRGRLVGDKRGRDWFVDATALQNYLESRDASGRPSLSRRARRAKPAHVAA